LPTSAGFEIGPSKSGDAITPIKDIKTGARCPTSEIQKHHKSKSSPAAERGLGGVAGGDERLEISVTNRKRLLFEESIRVDCILQLFSQRISHERSVFMGYAAIIMLCPYSHLSCSSASHI
jgi:hypothetical protein